MNESSIKPYSGWPIQDGHFGVAHRCVCVCVGGGGAKSHPLSKIFHIYPTIMKLGTLIPYLKIKQSLSSADIRIFSQEISKFCCIKKH